MIEASCFKAYDVRGRVPDALNPELARAVGTAFARVLRPASVVVGRDCRLSGPALRDGLIAGLQAEHVAVTDIGLCGTEEIYYAALTRGFEGGVMITGSHNPADENGMKFVRAGAVPVSGDSGLNEVRDLALHLYARHRGEPIPPAGAAARACFRKEYVRFLLDFTGTEGLKPLNIHADPGNGCAGLLLRELVPHLPYRFTFSNPEPDGTFPHGVPNPLLPDRREAAARAVRENRADLGLAWDGDFDRCFFYDADGRFIEGYYLVGLLAQSLLQRTPGARIIHDPRLIWNTQDVVRAAGGTPVMSKTGHAFIKERMRAEDAVYGGEMSAHHYFRDFGYCDSGMLPWLLVAALISRTGIPLARLVEERMAAFPCSGEINRRVADAGAITARIAALYGPEARAEDRTDGLSLDFGDWRFNLRRSNTEPLLRLNVEARADAGLMRRKTDELLRLIDACS